MTTIRKQLYDHWSEQLTRWGIRHGQVSLYSEALIEKLRGIYYGGLPASVLLLSNAMTNGRCYDRALLLARAFLDADGDVRLVYATIDSLRCQLDRQDASFADHCFVERITGDGQHFIYDTSAGLVATKRLYWLLEHPKVRKVNDKDAIRAFVKGEENNPGDKFAATIVLPVIEQNYGKPGEIYTLPGIELLQREVELYKQTIQYDELLAKYQAWWVTEGQFVEHGA